MPFIDDAEYADLIGSNKPFTMEEREQKGLTDLSGLDQKLVSYAGVLTPMQISKKLGIPAEDVVRRTQEVLNSVDVFSIDQMRAKQILSLNTFITEALQRLPTASEKAAPALMNATGGNISRALKELQDMEARSFANHAAMEQAYARRMVDIVARAYDRYLGRLSERFKGVPVQDLVSEFHEAILEIAKEIDSEG